ncbi:uncharacterized protein LOC126419597 [Schistocerca serialis cubense]|uniref:uncharacterized protein LOC126419597 n=1 Tax=Schistocerca serialis cubense TaxID=2023355 RepID=UPI00214ED50A|nr:uncharacterized protein LOC126419597 [Schistocerca serialis cubense]
MLDPFRGRYKFEQYIPNKRAKYGINCYALCDARTFYTLGMEVYAGKQPPGSYQVPNYAENVLLGLIQPNDKTGRNCRELNSSIFAFGEKPSNNCLICTYIK